MAKRTAASRGLRTGERVTPPRTVLDDQALALGTRIRERRRAKGLSLVKLAAETDLSHPFLSQVERGHARPSISSLQRIAMALDVDAAWLFGVVPAERADVEVVRIEELAPLRVVEGQAEGVARAFRAKGWTSWVLDIVELPDQFSTFTAGQHDVVAYVLEGTMEVEVEDLLFELGPCDTIFITAPRRRRFRSTSAHRTHVLLFVSDRPDLPADR